MYSTLLCNYHKQLELVGTCEVRVGSMFNTKEIFCGKFGERRHSETSTGVLIHLTLRIISFLREYLKEREKEECK
jgi:hypothetical protein